MTNLHQTLKNYQSFTPSTAIYPGSGTKNKYEILYLSLGLIGERTEWYESGYDKKEAGDIVWYISQLANVFGWDLSNMWNICDNYINLSLNLPEKLKKLLRDDKIISEDIFKEAAKTLALIKHQYKIMFYPTNDTCNLDELMISILVTNRDKLIDRQNRNVIKGDGDNR